MTSSVNLQNERMELVPSQRLSQIEFCSVYSIIITNKMICGSILYIHTGHYTVTHPSCVSVCVLHFYAVGAHSSTCWSDARHFTMEYSSWSIHFSAFFVESYFQSLILPLHWNWSPNHKSRVQKKVMSQLHISMLNQPHTERVFQTQVNKRKKLLARKQAQTHTERDYSIHCHKWY